MAARSAGRGADHRAGDPEIIDAEAARPYYSRFQWRMARTLFPADAWLRLSRLNRLSR
ncbi:hypothetical protein AB0F81_09330 [Actinoplanes sp. NPDC024001]|uniref:hypothetical protein n=1 Tax=Actinoplanes sp. NPDC024001 TaxID=3154598 RepID=UPI0033E3CB9D